MKWSQALDASSVQIKWLHSRPEKTTLSFSDFDWLPACDCG
ncbi:hypothetical protein GLE_1168 [Lysobacter enzymogenes]|uniref:Uncharacterized protein n=1 Tax=Lysobacter enzymogenes TaxID=69 RepID=A0A0S2DDA1_LYSEN|nr:hypothetical protein GLE_1168 [Lysobacter enzymogenes]